MPRDIYHDFVEMQELVNAGPRVADWLVQTRLKALAERSGAKNVASAVMTAHHDPMRMVTQYAVSFSSRAWTGGELHI